jgi:hypothetical protein
MIHAEDRIRVTACGCRYDVVTALRTHLCETHGRSRSQRGARHKCPNLIGWRVAPDGEQPQSAIISSRSPAKAIARSQRRHTRRRWVVVIEVNVTSKNIEQAQRHDPTACPIALALQRVFRRPVSVGTTLASVIYPHREYIYQLPPEARRFISQFDSGQPVRPLAFRAAHVGIDAYGHS